MKKSFSKIAAIFLASTMAFTACGGSNGTQTATTTGSETTAAAGTEAATTETAQEIGGEPITDLVDWATSGSNELQTFFILNTEASADLSVITNCYSPLLELDNHNQLQPAVAKEWYSEDDAKTWTFKLRDDVVWVDKNGNEKAKTTANDWVVSMEFILNFHKNNAENTGIPTTLIEGAQEYYDYTKELDPEEAKALDLTKFSEMVGVEAPDDYTLVYHLKKNAPYFDAICASSCLYAVSGAEIAEKGVDGMLSMNNENMWYNGPYVIDSYIQNNEKVLIPNESYWDKDCTLFNFVTIRMINDGNSDDLLFETGEVDQTTLSESNLRLIYNDPDHEFHDNLVEKRPGKFSFQMLFNYDKNNEDGTKDESWNKAAGNENFRKSIYYGLDIYPYLSRFNFVHPGSDENLAYTMKNLVFYSDGTDYVDKVIEKLGLTKSDGTVSSRLDETKAAEYRDKAIEELTAEGVTFPIEVDFYMPSGNQAKLDEATMLKEGFEAIGDNYITFNICTYVSSASQEAYNPRLQSFVINGWGADYSDPENFIAQVVMDNDGAYYANKYTHINDITDPDLLASYEEFTELANKASQIFDDNDKRYDAYAEAEAYLIEHALQIPIRYDVSWQLTKFNDYSRTQAMYGAQNYVFKNWETSQDAYTTEEYEQLAAEFYGN